MRLLNTLVIAGLMSGAALADYTKELNWTFELETGGRISLENINGNVEVTGQPGNTVEITALKKAGTEEYLADVIEEVGSRYAIDPNRIFVMGYSMGGYGAYHIAQTQPDRYAGIIAVSGAWEAAH